MLNRIYEFFKKIILDWNIFYKLIIFFVLNGLFALVLIGIVFNSKTESLIEKELSKSYELVVEQYVSNIEYKIDIYQTLLNNIANNPRIYEVLSDYTETSSWNSYDVGKGISNEVDSLLSIQNIAKIYNLTLFSFDEVNPVYGRRISNTKIIKNEPWYGMLEASNFTDMSFLYITTGTKKELITLIKPITDLSGETLVQRLGFVKLDVDARSFYEFGPIQNNGNKSIYILDDEGNIIIGNNGSNITLDKGLIKEILNEKEKKITTYMNNEKQILISRSLSDYNWCVLYLFNYSEIEKRTSEVRRHIFAWIIILLMIFVLLTILFSQKLTKRINVLINKMKKVENGDLEITEKIMGHDEIGVADFHFNQMVYTLENLINENYVQQLEQREAELNALQFQINPHFLYNTLEAINSLAAINEDYEICEISQKLGEMFKYSINSHKGRELTTLKKEIEHIKNYIYIQSIRFQDKFEVFYDISNNVRQYKILRFILQPLVENAIVHGFKNKREKGCIEIAAHKEEELLVISVEDDGVGMEQLRVEELNQYINENQEHLKQGYKRSVGVKNVNMRIKLAYGEQYGITINSEKYLGTRVVIKLPIYGGKWEEGGHV